MRNRNCGCGRNNCPTCCPKKNASGPTGATGPTGPCCTGPTGPSVSGAMRSFACGRASVDEECNLIIFAACHIQSFRAVDVGDGIRGWEITSDPFLCTDLPAGQILFGQANFVAPGDPIAQTPQVDIFVLNPRRQPIGGGMCVAVFTLYLLDSVTGLPRDPCEGNLFNTAWNFNLTTCECNQGVLVDSSVPSPCGPVCPPPPAPGLNRASLARGPSGKLSKFDW